VVKKIMGNLLKSLVTKKGRHWDQILAQEEFSFKNFVNKSTGKIPFEIVYGIQLREIIELRDVGTRAYPGLSSRSAPKIPNYWPFRQHLRSTSLSHTIIAYANKKTRTNPLLLYRLLFIHYNHSLISLG
jgi:hypothetical protein